MILPQLIRLSERYTSEIEKGFQGLPGLSIFRRDAASDIETFVYDPVICLILQGSKTTSIGDQRVDLQPGEALLVSHDLPVVSRITRASAEMPYLAVILSLDLTLLRSLYEEVADAPVSGMQSRSLSAGRADPAVLAALIRYFGLMDDPLDAKVLGPSILREIHYRLLVSPIGAMLRELLVADSHASKIARAIQRLRADFRRPLSIPHLARMSGMSASSFHAHFRSVTGATPLQYLKDLRLIEARMLLSGGGCTVAETAFSVGYESPTHFSRDYRRKFGHPPSRDVGAGVCASAGT